MFKDYYEILEISFGASQAEIKTAYRAMALKWHPDKHPEMDVKDIMQDINEAYAILKDEAKRKRYDREYVNYQKIYSQSTNNSSSESTNKESTHKETSNNSSYSQSHKSYEYDYTVQDEDLKEDIRSAREYAKELVDEFFLYFKRNTKVAAEGAWEGVKGYVYSLIILIIIGSMIRVCVQ